MLIVDLKLAVVVEQPDLVAVVITAMPTVQVKEVDILPADLELME